MHQRREVQKELDYVKSNFKTQNLTELASRDKQANELDAEIKEIEFRKQQQNIISPVDGYVNTMMVHTVGGVVTPAEKIISVVPANAPLVVKVNVLNKDIGFIREQMPVLIKIDTFDFQKYGIVNGTVKKISKDSKRLVGYGTGSAGLYCAGSWVLHGAGSEYFNLVSCTLRGATPYHLETAVVLSQDQFVGFSNLGLLDYRHGWRKHRKSPR